MRMDRKLRFITSSGGGAHSGTDQERLFGCEDVPSGHERRLASAKAGQQRQLGKERGEHTVRKRAQDQVRPLERTRNVFMKADSPIVAKVPHLNGDYLPESVETAIDLLGGLDPAIQRGDRVMLKPNFNVYSIPLSTDLAFLSAVIEILQEAGAHVVVGELTGRANWPTAHVVERMGVLKCLKRYGVPFVDFEHDEWLELRIDGVRWETIHVPRSIYEAEKRVYLANMRCHSTGRFTASLKLSVGWISPEDREILHTPRTDVEFKIAELNLGWQPNLVLIDGRRSTVTWHGRGEYVYPNIIMASGDMVSADAEAVKELRKFPQENGLGVPLQEMGQLKSALELGLGSLAYEVVAAEAHTCTEQKGLAPGEMARLLKEG